MATRSKRSRKPAPKKAARKAAAKRAPRKAAKQAPKKAAAPKKPAVGSDLEALARRIVRATQNTALFDLRQLYADGATSREATGDVATGYAGLEAKMKQWESMQMGTTWRPRNVFVKGDTICIEWDATVKLRDGRTVSLLEVAVHEVKSGKIAAERYYYNPTALAPQTS
jgi:ketosteroid isomerase-like protein